MLKIKHARTADAVVVGYRIHKSGQGVGSLLLGLHTDDGRLVNVGGISAFTNARRLELVDELADLVVDRRATVRRSRARPTAHGSAATRTSASSGSGPSGWSR